MCFFSIYQNNKQMNVWEVKWKNNDCNLLTSQINLSRDPPNPDPRWNRLMFMSLKHFIWPDFYVCDLCGAQALSRCGQVNLEVKQLE